jgi:hypothetical protein
MPKAEVGLSPDRHPEIARIVLVALALPVILNLKNRITSFFILIIDCGMNNFAFSFYT